VRRFRFWDQQDHQECQESRSGVMFDRLRDLCALCRFEEACDLVVLSALMKRRVAELATPFRNVFSAVSAGSALNVVQLC